MNLCKTCKHWSKTKYSSNIEDIGVCDAVEQYWESSEWDSEGKNLILKPEFANKLAFVRDTSDYYASLMPRANFGCIQHEELNV